MYKVFRYKYHYFGRVTYPQTSGDNFETWNPSVGGIPGVTQLAANFLEYRLTGLKLALEPTVKNNYTWYSNVDSSGSRPQYNSQRVVLCKNLNNIPYAVTNWSELAQLGTAKVFSLYEKASLYVRPKYAVQIQDDNWEMGSGWLPTTNLDQTYYGMTYCMPGYGVPLTNTTAGVLQAWEPSVTYYLEFRGWLGYAPLDLVSQNK